MKIWHINASSFWSFPEDIMRCFSSRLTEPKNDGSLEFIFSSIIIIRKLLSA